MNMECAIGHVSAENKENLIALNDEKLFYTDH